MAERRPGCGYISNYTLDLYFQKNCDILVRAGISGHLRGCKSCRKAMDREIEALVAEKQRKRKPGAVKRMNVKPRLRA